MGRIPRKDSEFDGYIRTTTVYLDETDSSGLANYERLGMSTANRDLWVAFHDEWLITYPLYQNTATRTVPITNQKNQIKDDFIAFAQPQLDIMAASEAINPVDRETLHLKKRDTVPTPRPPIETSPSVRLIPKGGGRIHIECRVESDSTRPSMHPDADIVELRYSVGDPAPESPAQATNGFNSSRSNWAQQIDILEQGKRFYAYARWANTSDESKSGPWSERYQVIVA